MISIETLRFGYGKTPVVEIDHLALPDHENLMLLGDSGSGKTSLLLLLAGLLRPDAGRISLNGTDMATLAPTARDRYRGAHIGFVFQQPHLMAPLTVLQNVLMAPAMGGMTPDVGHARHLLERLGVAELADRKPHQLSQGQMQRVGIARALAHRPTLVLADEPTSALDDRASKAAIELLLDMARETGSQVVVATHDARIKPHFRTILTLRSGAQGRADA